MFKKRYKIFLCAFGLLIFSAIMPFTALNALQENDPQAWKEMANKHFEEGNFNDAARYYNKLAFFYWENDQLQEAANNFLSSVEANEKIGNTNAIKHIYNNLGQIYFDLRDYQKSLNYFSLNVDISRQQNRRYDIASGLINKANVTNELNNYEESIIALEEAESIAREINDMTLLRTSYAMLAEAYERVGESNKSKEYFDLFYALERHLQQKQMEQTRQEASEKVARAETKAQEAETEKELTREELSERERTLQVTRKTLDEVEEISRERQLQIDLLNKERMLQEEQLKRQQAVRNGLIIFGILVAAVAALILYSYQQKKKANRLLSKQNKEISEQRDEIAHKNKELQKTYLRIKKQNKNISDSIAYAQRIQEAMLPDEENLKKHLPDSFVYYKPRDIVSGDFYWFSEVNIVDKNSPGKQEKGLVLACVDCTGHGVPGAFMSMIGINLLENITAKGVESAGKILEELHTSIRQSLRQHKSDNKDGMELSICLINKNKKNLEFAGAKAPLFYIQNGKSSFIKGDPTPIGGMQPEPKRKFTNHKVEIKTQSTFYLFTDGYADQFGGNKGYKFSTRKLRELLSKNSINNLEQQKKVLNEQYEKWKNNEYKQLDDILVMGFKI